MSYLAQKRLHLRCTWVYLLCNSSQTHVTFLQGNKSIFGPHHFIWLKLNKVINGWKWIKIILGVEIFRSLSFFIVIKTKVVHQNLKAVKYLYKYIIGQNRIPDKFFFPPSFPFLILSTIIILHPSVSFSPIFSFPLFFLSFFLLRTACNVLCWLMPREIPGHQEQNLCP